MPSGATDKRFYVFAACVVGALALIGATNLYQAHRAAPHIRTLPYSQFLDDLEQGRVRSVILSGQVIDGFLTDRTPFESIAAEDPDLVRLLRSKGVAISALRAPGPGPSWGSTLGSLLPMLLLVAFAMFFMTRGSAGGSRGLARSQAKPLLQAHDRITFADVAGVDEARDALQEMVQFLRDPQKFRRLGGRIPKGVLLVGPPGTGKTLLARAVAGEAHVPFFTISGSHFVEMYVGVGAARVRDLFSQARKHAPCIIFMDEIDAVGRRRGAGVGGGNDEREQTLNQLLVEMDGFENRSGVILIAATNRPDVLDPALLRPGRFDRQITVDAPDVLGREQILTVHARHIELAPGTDLRAVARATPGFSGADLMNLVNEAALLAARRGHESVGSQEFEDARDTLTLGAERRTHVMSADEKRLIAYREGGRALIAMHLTAADPVQKVTLLARGRKSGGVRQRSEKESTTVTFEQMTSRLAVLLGGRVAEELAFGRSQVSSGTAGDIEEATKLARLMVTRWGLSETLGTVAYGENQDEVFLGHAIARQQNVSEHTAQIIAKEVRALIDTALAQGRAILEARRPALDALAEALMENETLSVDEIQLILRRQCLPVQA